MDVAEKRSRAQARVEAARRRGDTAEVAKWEAYLATLPAADSAPAAAAPPPKLPAKKPSPVRPTPAPARAPAPAPVPVVAPKPALPPAAKPMPARVELVREAPQVIDVSGAKAAKADVVKTAPETQSVLQQQLIAKGMRPDVAEQVAKDQVARVLRDAAGARGDAGPADATLLPFAKESKIVPYLDGYVYTDDGLGIRKAGALELAGEALKRQQVMSSQQRAEYRAVADKDTTGGLPVSGVLSAPDPRTGRVVETPFGAAVRGATSWLPSALSTAIMDYAPIFYDVDEQGNPVDKEQAAYKVREFLDEFAPEASKFQRETGRLSPKAALLPAPFTGTTRKTVKGPAYADPTGGRAAPTTGSFVSDVALHVAKGRSMGDELISLPAYAEGNEGASFATGILLEVLTPAGPGTAVRSGRALLKAASGAADAAGATKTARALGAVAAPVEAARTSLVRSAGKDIVGDSEELAKAADRNQVLNVVADKVVEDVVKPAEAGELVQNLRFATPEQAGVRLAAARELRSSPAADYILGGMNSSTEPRLAVLDEVARAGRQASEEAKKLLAEAPTRILDRATSTPVERPTRADAATPVNAGTRADATPVNGATRADPSSASGGVVDPADVALKAYQDKLIAASADWEDAVRDMNYRYANWRQSVASREIKAAFRQSGIKGAIKAALDASPEEGSPLMRALRDFEAQNIPAGEGEVFRAIDEQVAITKAVPSTKSRAARAILGAADQVVDDARATRGAVVRGPAGSLIREEGLRKAAREMIKADLRNIVPEDLVFLTRTVMVPRAKVTPELMEMVASETKKLDISPMEVGGELTYSFGRSPEARATWAAVMGDVPLPGGGLGADEFAAAIDAFHSKLVSGRLGADAVPAVFGGRQVEAALRATERTGGVSDKLDAARDVILAMTPTALRRSMEESLAQSKAKGKGLNLTGLFSEWLFSAEDTLLRGSGAASRGSSLRPAIFDVTVRRINEATAQVTDRFRAELRSLGGRADALDAALLRRYTESAAERQRSFVTEMRELMDTGMSPAQAAFVAGYRLSGDTEVGLGTRRLAAWGLKDGTPESSEFVSEMIARAGRIQATASWERLLEIFFGADEFNRVVRAQMKNVLGDEPPVISIASVTSVLAALRRADPSLGQKGIASTVWGGGADNIVGLLAGWALDQDRARIVRNMTKEMLDERPELAIWLSPSSAGNSATAPLRRRHALPIVNQAVAGSLLRVSQRQNMTGMELNALWNWPIAISEPGSAYQHAGDGPRLWEALQGSEFFKEVNNIVTRDILNVSKETQEKMVRALLDSIVAKGTMTQSAVVDAIRTLQFPELEKQATFKSLQLGLERARRSSSVLDKEVVSVIDQTGPAALAMVFEDMKAAALRSLAPQVEQDLVRTLRAYGMTTAADLADGGAENLVQSMFRFDPDDPRVLVYGSDFAESVKALSAGAADGRLLENLEGLRRRSRKAHEVALGLLDEASGFAQRTYAAGMLGGILLPNTRYLGVNLITAPLVMLTTLGRGFPSLMDSSLVKAKAQVALSARAPSLVAPGAADDALFTDARGVPWTRGALLAAADRNNLGMTRGDIEFESGIVQQIAADMRVLSDGAPESVVDAAWRLFRPDTPSVWQRIANETDMAFRQSVFAGAIKAGRTEEQAAELARASVLDYGATPAPVRAGVARIVMFASFRLAMLTELLNGLARDPSTFARVLRAQMRQQQEADTWMTGEDQNKTRLPVWRSGLYDLTSPYAVIGPQNPMSSTLLDLVNAATYVSQLGQPDNNAGQRAVDELVNQALTPGMEMVITSVTTPTTEGPAGKAPTEYIVAARFADALLNQGNPDLYHWFIDYVDLEPVPDDKMRAGQETVNGYQWRFGSSEGKRKFQLLQAGLAQVGVKRMIEDYSKALITVAPPTGVDPKRRGEPTLPGFLLGAETSIQAPGAEDLEAQSYEMAARRLQQMQIGTQR